MNQSAQTSYELVIIGAGPSGLAAALYAAREGLKTLVLEKAVVGGLAAITATIDNYPGFEQGVGGLELAEHLEAHAKRFGANIQTGVEVTALQRASDGRVILETGAGRFSAEAVLIATGSTYRHLGVPGEKALVGRGVHFCATCDAPLYKDKNVLVVGGGNSAVQESLFITKFARQVTLLVRGPELQATEVLREQLQSLPNVSYQFNTTVTAVNSDGQKFTSVDTRNSQTPTPAASKLSADAVFVFIGLLANTKAFARTLQLDDRNFIVTGPEFTTSVPGIFAAGDVRSGSTWQIASAIGEGVSATLAIRAYLNTRRHQLRHKTRAAAKSSS